MEPTTTPTSTTDKVLYERLSMDKAKKLAKQLQKFAEDNRLSVEIAGKQYMQAEGWQFIGTHMGLTDIIESCDKTDSKDEIQYKASVIVINQQGTIISRGIAYCSNKESKRKGFEEYAIASMAQTRAIGKAYRNFLAWIVKMAGYEATPYDEIDPDKMESDLSKGKQKVLKKLTDLGITDTSAMMDKIEEVAGKRSLDTIEDVNGVLALL